MSNTQMGGPSFSRRLKLLGRAEVQLLNISLSLSSWGKFKCKLLGIGLRQRD